MNWYQGLRRISAVFWSFWAAVVALYAVAFGFEAADDWLRVGGRLVSGLGFTGLLFYFLHKLTCWVIGGFFKPA